MPPSGSRRSSYPRTRRVIVLYTCRSLTEWRGDTVRWRKRAWLWFGPMSDSRFFFNRSQTLRMNLIMQIKAACAGIERWLLWLRI